MVCLGLEPGAARWKVQTNPLSYGGLNYKSFLNGPSPACFYLFSSFQTHIKIFTTNKVYSAGIQTQNLWNMSVLP